MPVRLQRHGEGVRHRRLGGDVLEVHAQMDDGLRDLRADPADDAIGAHQPGGGHRLQ